MVHICSSSSRIEMHFASFLPRLRLFSFRILSSFDVRKNIFKLLLLILRKGILPQGCFFLSLMQSLTCFLVLHSARISAEIYISHLVLSGFSQQIMIITEIQISMTEIIQLGNQLGLSQHETLTRSVRRHSQSRKGCGGF